MLVATLQWTSMPSKEETRDKEKHDWPLGSNTFATNHNKSTTLRVYRTGDSDYTVHTQLLSIITLLTIIFSKKSF